MKRKAPNRDGPQSGPSKRQQTLPFQPVDLALRQARSPSSAAAPRPSTENSTPTSSLPDHDDDDDHDHDHDNYGNPSAPPADNPDTPAGTSIPSTAHTSRTRKFPSDLKTIPCTYPSCAKTFNRPARLAAHLRSHTNDRPHRCPYPACDKTYLEEKHLAQHVKGSHTHERRYACPEAGCGKAFVTATRLRRHAAVHEGRERFRCRGHGDCAASFRKHQTLQRHVRVAHLGLAAFVCAAAGAACEAGFDTAGALRRHVEREHGAVKFWCEECGGGGGGGGGGEDEDEDEDEDADADAGARVGFRTLLALQTHMRREHVDCVFCEVKCASQAELERHVDMYHSGTTVEDRKTVECTWDGCGKKFTRVSNLNTHIRTAHQGLRFVCGQVDTFETADIADWNWMEEGCQQTFVSRLKLEEHVRFIHLGRKRPPKVYTVQSALPGEADEMSAAVPTRTIPCSAAGCDAKFVRHHDLEKHLQSGHGEPHEAHEDPIDPRLHDAPAEEAADDEQYWIEAAVTPVDEQAGFDMEWTEMRRLIDLDSLVEKKE
ncbi:hypothetical protein BT67DRAFT_459297 [Trichocladium antarcticum]|uniref:C2H2-type domain-containing protein n=1 Tax=Trichocladium antarcticum TaxID=1450529 RepID=A0AAN6ZI56_9PEZI|nr:hypothetical protein BT67DRAFT_459297 [Trichocladium antarcticum]